jgi:hypothetical protein
MKRILSLVLILILSVAALTACEFPWGDKTPSYDLDNAKGAVVELYPALVATKDNPVPNTIDNYNLTKVLPLKDGTYTIEWATDNVNVQVKDYVPADENDVNTAENTATVHVPERPETGAADIAYTLRALITAPDGSTTYVLFNLKVPALNPNTFAEFMAAEKDAFITVSGVVTAIQRKADGNQDNGVYFQDADGGYYAYQVDDAAMEGLEIGMTVVVSGKRGTYGVAQITSPSLKVIDTTIKTVEPIDFTDLVKNADKLTNAELLAKNSVLVTIKGATLAEAGDNGYYYFLIGEHKVYFRISGSNNPMTADEKAALIKAHADNKGATADITGLVNAYNGVLYLTPAGGTTITNIVASTCEHTGGTATCKDLAVCDLCGVTYGDYADHVEGTAATCTTLAKCSVCEKTYGSLAAHTFTEGVCSCGVTNVLSTDAEYLLGMIQPNAGGIYYFKGVMDGFYYATSTDKADAVKVKLVAVEGVDGGYYITFVDGETVKYLNIVERSDKAGSANIELVDEIPSHYFTYDATYNTFVSTFEGAKGEVSFFLGNYGTNTKLSGSAVKYLAQGNFVASLFVVTEDGGETPEQPGEGGNEGGETPEQPGEGGGETSDIENVKLTVDSLGLTNQSYTAGTATVGGVGFEWIQLGNYGDGIQVRDKDGKTSSMWNTTAFSSPIARIELVYSSTKDVTHSNPDCAIYSFGNGVDNYTCTVKLSTEAGVKTYTITPDAETYTYFRFEHDLGYTQYWESITIVLVDGTVITAQ